MKCNKKMGLLEEFLGWYLRDFGLILFFIKSSLRPWTNHPEKHQPRMRFCTQRWFLAGAAFLGTCSPHESKICELVGLKPDLSICASLPFFDIRMAADNIPLGML